MLIARIVYRRVVAQTFGVLGIITATLVVTQLLGRAELLIGGGRFALGLLYFAIMIAPSIIVVLMPVALLVGVARAFRTLNEDREITIAQANGLSPASLARPIAVLTTGLAVIVLIVSFFIEPYANATSQKILNETSANALNNSIRLRSAVRLDGNMILWIGERTHDRRLGRIIVFDNSEPQIQRVITAEHGHLVESQTGNLLALVNGEIQSRHNQDDLPSRVEFISYALMLPTPGASATDQIRPRQASTMDLLAHCDTQCSSSDRRVIQRELHRRFSDWLQVFAFGAIAVYFFVRPVTTMSNLRQHLVFALLIGLAVRGVAFVALSGGGADSPRVFLAYLAPVLAALLFGALALMNRNIPPNRQVLSRLMAPLRKRVA